MPFKVHSNLAISCCLAVWDVMLWALRAIYRCHILMSVDCDCNRPSFLDEISSDEIARSFWPSWDVLVSFDPLHNFRARYPDEMSCFLGAVTSFACKSSCLFGHCAMSWWDDMLFGVMRGRWTGACWMRREIQCTRWFVGRCVVLGCASWVVIWRGKWMYVGWWWLDAKGQVRWETERVCVKVVWCVSPACMTTSRDVRMFEDDVT